MDGTTLTASRRTIFTRRQWLIPRIIDCGRRGSRCTLIRRAWRMCAWDEGRCRARRRRRSPGGAVLLVLGFTVGIPGPGKLFVLSKSAVSRTVSCNNGATEGVNAMTMINRSYHPLFEPLHLRLCLSILTLLFFGTTSTPNASRRKRGFSVFGAKLGVGEPRVVRGIVAVE